MAEHKDAACLFCAIVDKKINARIVQETDHVMAFHDINPVADTHLLIIPKIHLANVNYLSPDNVHVFSDMMLLAKDLALQLNLVDNGYRLVMNTGKNAGQTVFHLHMHLLGGRDFSWPPG